MPISRLTHRLVALRAMGSPPAGFLIESLLVPLNTVPAKKVWPIVRAYGLDDMGGLAITAFTTMDCSVLDCHRLITRVSIMFVCMMNANPCCRGSCSLSFGRGLGRGRDVEPFYSLLPTLSQRQKELPEWHRPPDRKPRARSALHSTLHNYPGSN